MAEVSACSCDGALSYPTPDYSCFLFGQIRHLRLFSSPRKDPLSVVSCQWLGRG